MASLSFVHTQLLLPESISIHTRKHEPRRRIGRPPLECLSSMPAPEKRDRGIEKVMARYGSPPSKGFKSRGYLNDPRIYALSHVVSNRTEKVVGNCCSRRTRILNNPRSFVFLDRSIIQVDKCIFIISGFWYSGFNLLWFKKKRTGNPWIFEGNYSSNRFSECIINARKRAWNVRNGRIGVEETSTGAEWKRRYFQRRLLVAGFSSISGGGRRPSREAAASSRPLMFLYLATSHLFTGLCPVDKLLAAIISRLNRDAGQLLLPFPRNFPSSFEDPSASSIENH